MSTPKPCSCRGLALLSCPHQPRDQSLRIVKYDYRTKFWSELCTRLRQVETQSCKSIRETQTPPGTPDLSSWVVSFSTTPDSFYIKLEEGGYTEKKYWPPGRIVITGQSTRKSHPVQGAEPRIHYCDVITYTGTFMKLDWPPLLIQRKNESPLHPGKQRPKPKKMCQ